jgi:hypothetical protein
MQTITIEPNKTFVWPKGLRLVPNEKVTIVLPGALVRKDEQIGAIIKVSDESEIGFQESQNPEELFSRIILKVAKGDGVRINRPTQAMLICALEQPITFQVED